MSVRIAKWFAFTSLLLATPAVAQTAFTMPPPAGVFVGGFQVVTTCGAASLTNGTLAFGAMDTTGKICTNASGGGGGGGTSETDGATFTASSSTFTPVGGEYSISPTTCAAGKQCTAAITANREITTHDAEVLAAVQAAVPSGTNRIGYTSDDPCANKTKLNKPFTTNGTASVELVALSGSTTIYVCSLHFIVSSASKVAFTTGTGTACATGNAAVIGSTTANIANSMSYAANGGQSFGNGTGTIAKGAASSALCMVNSVDQYTSGNLTYVQE